MITARQAMERAIEAAGERDWPGGRLWLDIARELRQGAQTTMPNTLPAATMTLTEVMSNPARFEGETAAERVTRWMDAPMPPVELPSNAHCSCGYMIVKQVGDDGLVSYVHRQTNQQTCPVPTRDTAGDETFVHTFAWPEGYSRP